jgi:hypothetical protein
MFTPSTVTEWENPAGQHTAVVPEKVQLGKPGGQQPPAHGVLPVPQDGGGGGGGGGGGSPDRVQLRLHSALSLAHWWMQKALPWPLVPAHSRPQFFRQPDRQDWSTQSANCTRCSVVGDRPCPRYRRPAPRSAASALNPGMVMAFLPWISARHWS